MSTLADIRYRLLDQVDADPAPSPEYVRRVNGFINRAYQHIVKDVPFLFFESQIRFRLQPSVESETDSDTFSLYGEDGANVPAEQLTTNGATSTVYAPNVLISALTVGDNSAAEFKLDRTWDTRDIELVTSTNEVVHRAKIRSIERTPDDRIRITINRPVDFNEVGFGPWQWRIFTSEYYLPHDVIEWRSGRVLGDSFPGELEVLGQAEAEDRWLLEDFEETSSGTPRYLFRRGWVTPPPPPRLAASVTDAQTNSFFGTPIDHWRGPEPPGQFSYVYTYAWGKRDNYSWSPGSPYPGWQGEDYERGAADTPAFQIFTTPGRARIGDPIFESAPSPISDTYTVPSIGPGGGTAQPGAVALFFEPISYMQGFPGTVTTGIGGSTNSPDFRDYFSGLYVRIYRRRHSTDMTNYDALATKAEYTTRALDLEQTTLPADDSYYLLAEVPAISWIDGNRPPYFIDAGVLIPDRSRRLVPRSGYQAVRFYPTPDDDYEMSIRALIRPDPLEGDLDPVAITDDAMDLVVYKAMTYFYDHEHSPGMSDRAQSKYNQELEKLRTRYGDLRPDNEVIYRRPARSGAHRSTRRRWWRRSE